MIAKQNNKIALDKRQGSFCIYVKETLECLYSNEVESSLFEGDFEKMSDFADSKFDQLAKTHH